MIIFAVIAGGAMLAGILLFLLIPEDSPKRQVESYLGDTRLIIPAGYFRFEHARSGGRMPEIDLAADAHTFRPAKLERKFRINGPDPIAGQIFLTLRSPEGQLSPGERTTRLYARFLQSDSWSHPGGLIMRRFEDDSPYQNEDLYMAPPEGRLFAARCRRPRQPPDSLPNTCQAELRIDGIDVRLRFSPDLLADWDKILAGTRGLLQSFRR